MTYDRTVHARTLTGSEVVRYDKAGKWYLETTEGKRNAISIRDAVTLALLPGSKVFTGLSGGKQFDARVSAGASA